MPAGRQRLREKQRRELLVAIREHPFYGMTVDAYLAKMLVERVEDDTIGAFADLQHDAFASRKPLRRNVRDDRD